MTYSDYTLTFVDLTHPVLPSITSMCIHAYCVHVLSDFLCTSSSWDAYKLKDLTSIQKFSYQINFSTDSCLQHHAAPSHYDSEMKGLSCMFSR